MSQGEHNGRSATSKDKFTVKWAENLRSSLKANHPTFVKLMCRAHVSSRYLFNLPIDFWKKYLPRHEFREMILEDEGGFEQMVNYLGDRGHFGGGWKHFARSHNLEVGDALVFELTAPTRFKVYIIKALEEWNKSFDEQDYRQIY